MKNCAEGAVFTIIGEAAQLTNRTMIVTAKTTSSVQCVSLCLHSGIRADETFLDYHCKPESTEAPNPNAPDPRIHVDFDFKSTALKDGAWVNLRQVWTVHKVKFRRDGQVENVGDLMKHFFAAQDKLYGRLPQPPSQQESETEYDGKGTYKDVLESKSGNRFKRK